MPELPEVETVKNILKTKVLGKEMTDVIVSYPNIIAHPSVIRKLNRRRSAIYKEEGNGFYLF